MPSNYKVLSQSKPAVAVLTDSYIVPGAVQTTVSTLTVANQGAVETSFRISIAVNGAVDSPEQYIYYDVLIAANDTFAATFGVTLGDNDVIRVYNTLATCSFNFFGVEITS